MQRMRKQTLGPIASVGAMLLASGAIVAAIAAGGFRAAPTDEPAVVRDSPVATSTPTPTVTPTPTATPTAEPVPVVVEAPPAEESSGPILCPEGWFANSVDDQGNEGNCAQGNDEGQPCVAYDDNNNCTAYYKP